jgi:hypothetical protein
MSQSAELIISLPWKPVNLTKTAMKTCEHFDFGWEDQNCLGSMITSWSTRLQFSNLHTSGPLTDVKLLVIRAAFFRFRDLWAGLAIEAKMRAGIAEPVPVFISH